MRLHAGVPFALILGMLAFLSACGDEEYNPDLSDGERSGALAAGSEDGESGNRQARRNGEEDEPEDILESDGIGDFESMDDETGDLATRDRAGGGTGGSDNRLRFAFEQGQRLQYLVSTDMETESPMAQQMPANMGDTEYTINIDVAEADSNRAKVEIKFEAVDNGPATQAMESMEMTATYDRFGNVISSSATVNGEPVEDAATMGAMGSMGALQLGFLGLQFPDRALKAKDSWEVEVDLRETMQQAMGGGPMMDNIEVEGGDIPVTYTLEGITTRRGRRVAEISYTSEGDMEMVIDLSGMGGNGNQNQQAPSELRMQMSMSSEGVILFDVLRGVIISNEGDSIVDINSQMFQMEQNIATSMRLVE